MSLVPSSDQKIRSAVLGAAGYSGAELCALLVANPYFSLDHAFASAGRTAEPLSNLYPRFRARKSVGKIMNTNMILNKK